MLWLVKLVVYEFCSFGWGGCLRDLRFVVTCFVW